MSTAARIEEQQRRERDARMAGRTAYTPSGTASASGKARSIIEDMKEAAREVEQEPIPATPSVIVIDDGIPMPDRSGRQRTGLHLEVANAAKSMSIGQSFISPMPGNTTMHVLKRVKDDTGFKFAMRTIDKETKKVRVWRVE